MTLENLILNGLHFSFEIFTWISFFLQCSMFVVAFLPKIEIGVKFKIISRNHSSTISCKNCNWQLQSDFAIYSCSYSSYQLKKIATKSCLQLKIAIHDFLQLLVELRLLSGCKNLQCPTMLSSFATPEGLERYPRSGYLSIFLKEFFVDLLYKMKNENANLKNFYLSRICITFTIFKLQCFGFWNI